MKDGTVVIDCIRGLTPKAEILTWTSFCHDYFRRVLHAVLFQPAWDYTLVSLPLIPRTMTTPTTPTLHGLTTLLLDDAVGTVGVGDNDRAGGWVLPPARRSPP